MLVPYYQQQALTVMQPDRRFNNNQSAYNTTNSSRAGPQQTPRNKNKPQVPLPNSRRSITPLRVHDRLASSPLRAPLESAIEKCAREKSLERHNRSRVLNRSSRREDSSIIRRGFLQEEDQTRKAHPQTVQFIKSYFDFDNLIPLQQFIDRVVQRYQNLWENQDIDLVLQHFGNKVADIFGSEAIEPRDLMSFTRENGMIGFILHVFRLINQAETPAKTQSGSRYQRSTVNLSRNMQSINRSFEEQLSECVKTQDLKNIIQQFMQLMYKEMEAQIYAKFNVEMRRMVLKFREAEKMVKKVQDNIIMHADYYEAQKLWKSKSRAQEEEKSELKKKLQRIEEELKREKQSAHELKNTKSKLQEENNKMRQNLEKYQNILLNRFEASDSTTAPLPPQARRNMGTPLNDRTQDLNSQNNVYKEPQPFQIKIDTHFIQREHGPPMIQNTTAFVENAQQPSPLSVGPNSNLSYTPIKMESSRPSLQGGIKAGTKIGDYTYSPYHSRITRPF